MEALLVTDHSEAGGVFTARLSFVFVVTSGWGEGGCVD